MRREYMAIQYFDSNCMLGQWNRSSGKCFYEDEDIIMEMDRAGIEKCIAFSSMAKYDDIVEGNRILVEKTRGSMRVLPCAVAIPQQPGLFPEAKEFCEFLAGNNIRSVRIFPKLHGVNLYKWLWEDLFTELEKRRIPVFVDFVIDHWSEGIDWQQILDMCEAFPNLPFILLRMGEADRYLYKLFCKAPNLYIETSYYLVHNGLEQFEKSGYANRLIFGTGMPVYGPFAPLGMLALSGMSEKGLGLAAGGNLERLIGEVNFHAI
jgi:predicted TIM-barrel fold metal-dependent hydrolase